VKRSRWRPAGATVRLATVAAALAVAGCNLMSGKHTRPPDQVRRAHGAIGAGGYSGLTGPRWGGLAGAAYFPAGRWGRFGVRAEARGHEGVDRGHAVLGVAYEAAASRPRIVLSLHADAGATFPDPVPVLAGGATTQIWLFGPLALALDTAAILFVDGTDTVLGLGTGAALQVAW